MTFIKIVDDQGRTPEQAVENVLHEVLRRLQKSGKPILDGLLWTVRNHFQTIYPDSKHYNPDKVTPGDKHDGLVSSGEINIDVPGVTRAYHDVVIRPRWRKALTIPIHRQAYGKKAADFNNLFPVKKKVDGKMFLAQMQGSQIVFLFRLAERAFQRQDERLMPSDENLADNIFSRIYAYLRRIK